MVRWAEYLALLLQQLQSLLWQGFDSKLEGKGNFLVLQAQPKKKKKERELSGRLKGFLSKMICFGGEM